MSSLHPAVVVSEVQYFTCSVYEAFLTWLAKRNETWVLSFGSLNICRMICNIGVTPAHSSHHRYVKEVKSFPSHKAHMAARIYVSLALSQTPAYTALVIVLFRQLHHGHGTLFRRRSRRRQHYQHLNPCWRPICFPFLFLMFGFLCTVTAVLCTIHFNLWLWFYDYNYCKTMASISRGVPVYFPAFTGTHCAYPQTDGQAELIWLAGYIPRWFIRPKTVTHPSTNRAQHRETSLITTNALNTTTRRHHRYTHN